MSFIAPSTVRDRQEVKDILSGKDSRWLVITGPCSAWPREATLEYARRLKALEPKLRGQLKIVLRAYTQKPRTSRGWPGPMKQPDPFLPPDPVAGRRYAKELLQELLALGLPLADEAVFTENAPDFLDFFSWVCVGARSTEDPAHRLFAATAGLPVGMKNSTSGSIETGVNGVVAAQHGGNPFAHVVLRGGYEAANYRAGDLWAARGLLLSHAVANPAVLVDSSHDNCRVAGVKDPLRQINVVREVMEDAARHPELGRLIKGFMIESFLKTGAQKLETLTPETLDADGLSVTDPCLSWEKTEALLVEMAQRHGRRPPFTLKGIPAVVRTSAPARRYTVMAEPGLLALAPDLLTPWKNRRVAVITDTRVKKLYGNALCNTLKSAGYRAQLFAFPAGERNKNERTKQKLDHALLKAGFGRDTLILALGGGVVGDMAGFTAATLHRGVPYLQLPTTLLAMADSAIGGKVGVNTPFGKNLVGAFYPPEAVWADTNTLKTLPRRHVVSGMMEVLKTLVCLDAESFEALKSPEDLLPALRRSMELKARIVSADEREGDLRMILNFGHTVGHALERLLGYRWLHGEAVGLGMMVEAELSVRRGQLSSKDAETLKKTIVNFGIDPKLLKRFSAKQVFEAMQTDKKNRAGAVRTVLLSGPGKVYYEGGQYAHAFDFNEFKAAYGR